MMDTPKLTACILGIGAAAAGVTFYLSRPDPEKADTLTDPQQKPAATAPAEDISASAPRSPVTPPAPNSAGPESSSSGTTRPAGIDEDTWERAQRNTKMIYGMAQQARESKWMERMIEGRVKSDAKAISDHINLNEDDAATMEALLMGRANTSLEQTRKVWDAMLSDEAKFTEMAAIRDMKERGEELSPELAAREAQLRQDMFGQFAKDGQTLTEEDVQKLFQPQRPENWYKDDAFLDIAMEDLTENQGASLLEYAGKLDYLDREQHANRTVTNIQRSTDLTSDQSDKLKQLYLETPEPSDEQLQQIIPADQLDAVKKASTSRRWRGWGR